MWKWILRAFAPHYVFGIDDLVIGMAASAVIGGAINAFGAQKQNSQAIGQSQNEMAFQERMSSTAYQRAVIDMERAGLNPMLAYQQGGASAPQGAMAPIVNPLGGAGTSAADVLSKAIAIKQGQADIEKTQADTEVQRQLAPKLAADARQSLASATATEYQVNKLLPLDERRKFHELGPLQYEDLRAGLRFNRADEISRYEIEKQAAESSLLGQEYEQRQKAFPAELRSKTARAMLEEYQVPGARNQADVDESLYGRSVRPYLGDVSSAAHSMATLARFRRLMGD